MGPPHLMRRAARSDDIRQKRTLQRLNHFRSEVSDERGEHDIPAAEDEVRDGKQALSKSRVLNLRLISRGQFVMLIAMCVMPQKMEAFSSLGAGLAIRHSGAKVSASLRNRMDATASVNGQNQYAKPITRGRREHSLVLAEHSSRSLAGVKTIRSSLATLQMTSAAAGGGNLTDSSQNSQEVTASSAEQGTDQADSNTTLVSKIMGNALVQFVICAGMYLFHVFVLCRQSLVIPENVLKVIGIGKEIVVPWESVVGTAILVCMATLGSKNVKQSMKESLSGTALLGKEKLPTQVGEERKAALPETFILLGLAYLGSGYVGQAIDLILCAMAALGAPLTLGMCRALQVLLSHLFWVALGSQILQKRTGDFYTSRKWFTFDVGGKNLWLMVIGGYWLTSYISTFAINLNELLNMAELPGLKQLHDMLNQLPESATETVLDGLKNPEANDLAARAVGAVGPCFTGPIWEEVLYRGFLLQALALFMKLSTAVDVSSLVFALNHMNARAFAHLYIVGWLWSVFYIKSKNLMVPILIHMMWNGRTFMAPI